MKKFLLLCAAMAILLPGCKKIEESIDALGDRIDKLENETIPTIDEQIETINRSIRVLTQTDEDLNGYIRDLEEVAADLQEQINDTNIKIDEVKAALQGEISTAKTEVLAQLDAVKAELEDELAQINATIETLKAKDEELGKKIDDLKSYVDTELGKTTDWVNATFATLEQYNAIVDEVTVIKAQIEAINKSIAELENRLIAKINEDIAAAVADLNTTIQQKVKEITDAYTEAIKGAKDELTAAYTAAIKSAIAELETSLKAWVGEQLSSYYTIAEVDAKILALQNSIKKGDEALQTQLNLLKEELQTMKSELTAAYQKAIQDAITTNNGVINTKIAEEIAAVNARIDSEVAAINAKIAAIEARLDNIEAKLAELLKRIQSVAYIPEYSDGKATVNYSANVSRVALSFEISPKDAVAELAKVWRDALTLNAVYTETRAISFVNMPIANFAADTENGVITISASGEHLSEDFFAGAQSASARLSISDGNNSVTSEYIPMVAKEVSAKELGVVPTNEIWYTSTDGNIVTPHITPYNSSDVFGANIVSNTYENGCGVITFDAPVTSIGYDAFSGCTSLTSAIIPDSVTTIGTYAFSECTSLTSVIIGNGVTEIGYCAFHNCTSLTSITIPDSVTEIEGDAFHNCTSLTSATIGNNVTTIGSGAFSDCTSLTEVYCKPTTPPTGNRDMFTCNASGRKIYVPIGSSESYKRAEYWSEYADYIVADPNSPIINTTDWAELPVMTDANGDGRHDTDTSLYYAQHLCNGHEKNAQSNGTARNYTVCYSAEHHCPLWVAAPRHKSYESGASRTDAYGKDPKIPSSIQYNSKSTGGGCNKGHMLGSAERLSSTATNKQVFYYTNIAPQYSDTFNTGGGAWNNLEDHIDGLVCSDTLYVVIGCYFDTFSKNRASASPKKISFGGRIDVSCPTMFYYALLRTKSGSSGKRVQDCSASELQCAAFTICHEMAKGHKPEAADMMSISDLEKLTGVKYFANVPNAPKSTYNTEDWL